MKKIVLGLLCASAVLVGCSSNEDTSKLQETIDSLRSENEVLKEQIPNEKESYSSDNQDSDSEDTDTSIEIDDIYGLDQELSLGDGSQETARIKIVEATTNQSAFPDHMISIDDYDTTKMVAVKIEYTNLAIEEPFLPYADYFQAYGTDGKALIQVNQQNGQDAIPIGRTATTQLFWELPVDGNDFNSFEIDFVPSSKIATFSLDVTH